MMVEFLLHIPLRISDLTKLLYSSKVQVGFLLLSHLLPHTDLGWDGKKRQYTPSPTLTVSRAAL
jgi:hypothetical protein